MKFRAKLFHAIALVPIAFFNILPARATGEPTAELTELLSDGYNPVGASTELQINGCILRIQATYDRKYCVPYQISSIIEIVDLREVEEVSATVSEGGGIVSLQLARNFWDAIRNMSEGGPVPIAEADRALHDAGVNYRRYVTYCDGSSFFGSEGAATVLSTDRQLANLIAEGLDELRNASCNLIEGDE